jgi:hypothetical protein
MTDVYILFHFSRFHSVWDSKEKAVEYVRNYTNRFKKLKNAGPMNFYITKATINNSEYDMTNHMIWSSWYQGRQEIKELMETE